MDNGITLEILKNALRNNRVEITFKKKNGESRVMTCTTNLEFIPPSAWPKDNKLTESKHDERIVRVFDIDAYGWRSFIFDNLTTMRII